MHTHKQNLARQVRWPFGTPKNPSTQRVLLVGDLVGRRSDQGSRSLLDPKQSSVVRTAFTALDGGEGPQHGRRTKKKYCSRWDGRPLKGKCDALTQDLSCRTYSARPIFSADDHGATKFKMERFLHPGQSAMASVYAPIAYPTLPLLAFHRDAHGDLQLALTGELARLWAFRGRNVSEGG